LGPATLLLTIFELNYSWYAMRERWPRLRLR